MSGPNPDFLLASRTSGSAECRHGSGRAVRWSSYAILLSASVVWLWSFSVPGELRIPPGAFQDLARTSFFRIDKAMSSLPFVASAGRFTGYDPG